MSFWNDGPDGDYDMDLDAEAEAEEEMLFMYGTSEAPLPLPDTPRSPTISTTASPASSRSPSTVSPASLVVPLSLSESAPTAAGNPVALGTRFRLRSKGPAPSTATPRPLPLCANAAVSSAPAPAAPKNDEAAKPLAKRLWHLRVQVEMSKDKSAASYVVRRERARKKVKKLGGTISRKELVALLDYISNNAINDPELKETLTQRLCAKSGDVLRSNVCTSSTLTGVMLTINGQWGVVDAMPFREEPHAALGDDDENLKALAAWVEGTAQFTNVWSALDSAVRAFLERYTLTDGSWNVEICRKTLLNSGVVRLHCHVFLSWHPGRYQIDEHFLTFFKVLGSKPHVVPSTAVNKRKNTIEAIRGEGHFYIMGKKRGFVKGSSTLQPFTDYCIRPQQIQRMFVAGHYSADQACDHFLSAGLNAEFNVRNVLFIAQKREEMKLDAMVLEAQRKLRRIQKPPRQVEFITKNWVPQYEEFLHRYRFLVLDGPSRTGKTTWSRAQAEVGEVYEVNCAGQNQMNMRGFVNGKHKVVVADEATPWLVLCEKKLFQAQCSKVAMGQSPTMKDVYEVFTHRVKFIVCSNNWMRLVEELEDEDKDWLRENSVYYYTDPETPMWEQ